MALKMKTGDLTEGNPLKLIVMFALPLILGNIFQQFYVVVDTIVVGKALHVQALAAMGTAGGLDWLFTGMILGLTQGFSVLMAQEFGARKMDSLKHVIAQSIILSAVFAVLFLTMGQSFLKGLLTILNTPAESFDYALQYMRVMYSGIPIVMAFNLMSAILRALGDSKTPLYAMLMAAVTNIVLDIVFVLVLRWGIVGAAAASLTGQLVSCVYCFQVIRKHELMKLSRRHFRLDWALIGRLLGLGVPIAVMNAVSMVGGIIIQGVVNGYGVIYTAAYTANHRLYGVLEIAATSCGYALTTYMGQNLGAGKFDRLGKGMRATLLISVGISIVLMTVLICFRRAVVGMFISGTPQEVAETSDLASQYLLIMAGFLPVLYLLHIFRAALQGLGNSVLPMISGVSECIMRVGCAILIPMFMARTGMFFAEPLAWFAADIILIPSYFWKIGQLRRQMKPLR